MRRVSRWRCSINLASPEVRNLTARSSRRREKLLHTGRAVTAKVESVAQNLRLKANGRHPWVIHCQWHNPATGQVHLFTSENL